MAVNRKNTETAVCLTESGKISCMNENIIYKRFADVVSKKPGRPAVYQEDRTFTFSQLNELIKSVAAAFPVKSERIGIITDHGAGIIASMLAVLKAGSAYVPAEPDFPTERIRFMMTRRKAASALSSHS